MLSLQDYQAAARARAHIREFNRRSDEIARKHGLTPQRFLLLLLIKGACDGSARVTVEDAACGMLLAETTVAELARRAEAAGLVVSAAGQLRLTEDGERLLAGALAETIAERERLVAMLAGARTGLRVEPGDSKAARPHRAR